MRWLNRFIKRAGPTSPALKSPVKVSVTARRVMADGTLGERIEVKNITVTPVKEN
jgi:hypothetical protein